MKKAAFFLLMVLCLIVVACGDSAAEQLPAPSPTPIPPTPTPTPEELLERAVEAWNETESFHFTLALEGRQIDLDEAGTLSFTEVEGDIRAPDRLQAETLVSTPFGSTRVALIAIGEQQWLTNPLSGEWGIAPPSMEAEVTGLFDPERGLGTILLQMEGVERLAEETIDGEPVIHLRGTLPGSLLSDFADDLPETVTVDLWFGADDYRIRKIVITEPGTADEMATWTFLFTQFNAEPTIEPPI